MIIREILRENGITLSEKGEECFIYSIKSVFPALESSSYENVITYLYVDLKKEDCIKILHIASKYAKLSVFS